MLLNRLVGSERTIVGDVPGTTRDAIDTMVDMDGKQVLLIDTAGIRRRGKIEVGVEKYSVIRALRAIDRADVVLLVMDASETVSAQDLHVAGYVEEAARGVVVVVNKWDIAENKNKTEWTEHVRSELKFMDYALVLYTSALTGEGVDKLLPRAFEAFLERQKQIATKELDEVVRMAMAAHIRPRKGNRILKLSKVTQTATNPPVFTFLINDAKLIHFSYKRYLENKLRQAFGFAGTPIRLVFKGRGER
jgi:GTP-binding protein